MVSNNFIYGSAGYGSIVALGATSVVANGLIINHNIIEGDISGGNPNPDPIPIYYASITNNIFFYAIAANSYLYNSTISNNLFYGTYRDSIPIEAIGYQNTESNNYITVSPNYQFNNKAASVSSYPALLGYNWHLLPTSPGHNGATDGTDCGVYGGNYPMNFTGSPIPPQMFQLNINNMIVPVGGTLNVQFEARQQAQ
ncbi:MAG: hypothetical protein ACLQQ4_16200 [Bacteroidia bacterium]